MTDDTQNKPIIEITPEDITVNITMPGSEEESPDISEVSPAEMVINLENSVKNNLSMIKKGKQDLKKLREMMNDMLVNDATYQEHDKAVKEATKIRMATKSQLLKQPATESAQAKIKELGADLKDAQTALSEYLSEYKRLSGANEIIDNDGEAFDIVASAKLVKRSSRQ
jgi:hypothetical protein